jgi:hypothetical protein
MRRVQFIWEIYFMLMWLVGGGVGRGGSHGISDRFRTVLAGLTGYGGEQAKGMAINIGFE